LAIRVEYCFYRYIKKIIMLKLTPVERSALRAEAHGLKPVVMIGESGLTESVMKEIAASLDAHGLIKVRVFGDDREARVAMYEQICEELDAPRSSTSASCSSCTARRRKTVKERSSKAGKGMREVTIVKPAPAAPRSRASPRSCSRVTNASPPAATSSAPNRARPAPRRMH
jgi:RNA-binding protein